MGKIIGSWFIKLHQHDDTPEGLEGTTVAESVAPTAPTISDLTAALVSGLAKELGGEWTVSLAEKTDNER